MKKLTVIADRSDGRDNNFNLLRILAAAGVLFSHSFVLSLGTEGYEPLSQWLGKSLGSISVLVFFAISGFFITRSFDRRKTLVRFIQARIFRIFPGLAIILLLTVLIGGLVLTTAPDAVYWPASVGYFFHNLGLFSMQYELPGVFDTNPYGPPVNGSLWTLSYEVLCYFGVVLCGLLGLFKRRGVFAIGMAVFLLVYAVSVMRGIHPRIDSLMQLGLPFITGMAFYLWREHIRLSLSLAIALVLVALLFRGTQFFDPIIAVTLSYTIFVIGYAQSPFMLAYNKLGDYSYGLYIYAFPIQQIVASNGITTPAINIMLALPASLACAVLSWHLVEAPAMAFGRNLGRRRFAPNKSSY